MTLTELSPVHLQFFCLSAKEVVNYQTSTQHRQEATVNSKQQQQQQQKVRHYIWISVLLRLRLRHCVSSADLMDVTLVCR